MLLLLCIMSDTDSELGNFSCHRQGWQLFWIQQCEIRDHVGVSSRLSCLVTRERVTNENQNAILSLRPDRYCVSLIDPDQSRNTGKYYDP